MAILFLWAAASSGAPAEVTAASEQAAARAIQFLVSAQNLDGSWGIEPGQPGDPGTTAMVLLALLSGGDTPRSGPRAHVVRRGASWLVDRAGEARNGDIAPDMTTLLHRKLGRHIHSFLTAMALAELVGMMPDPEDQERITAALDALVGYIERSQQPDGLWGTSYETVLTTTTGWLALRSASAAGRSVEGAAPERTVATLLRRFDAGTGGFRDPSRGNQVRFMSTAAALRVLYGWGERDREEVRRATDALFRMRWDAEVSGSVGGEEYLGLLFGTQALYHRGDETWLRWYGEARDRLVAIQNEDGSWTGHHCITSRVFCTACALWTLQMPRRLLVLQDE